MLMGVPPRAVGPYEILSVIGRGGIGTVYRARDRRSGERVALKVLGPAPAIDATAARRLAREFEALRELDHPNIVRVYEAGVAQGYSFLAMELVEGLDLRSYLSPDLDGSHTFAMQELSRGAASGVEGFDLEAWALEPATDELFASTPALPPGGAAELLAFAEFLDEPETDPGRAEPDGRDGSGAPGEAAVEEDTILRPDAELCSALNRSDRLSRLEEVLRQVCSALGYLHGRGLVHRDLKPSNIMVDDRRRARIMDFGLVKPVEEAESLTLAGRVVGTYRYMAPEQARGLAVDPRADLYSLGVILYELLCGRPPFLARSAGAIWHDIVEHEPPALRTLNPGVSPRLAAVAERLLRKHPAERFPDAASLLAALGG